MGVSFQKEILLFFVEKPPVANIVIPCAMLSNKVIPVRNNDNEQRIVNKISKKN